MIREIEDISRERRVSSTKTRELTDTLYNRISWSFHRLLQVYGMARTATVCLELTNASMMTVLASTEKDEQNVTAITAYDEAIYPSIVEESEKAERNQEFVSITSKRVNSRLVLADENGVINPSLEIIKTAVSGDQRAPRYIIENSISNAFRGDLPYVARYVKDDVSKVVLNLSITSKDQPFTINALKFIPMPAMGATVLEALTYDVGKNVVMNGGVELPPISVYQIERTYQGYIHFEPVSTTELTLSLASEVYLSALGCIAIGINKIVGEFNTYAIKSYIGWPIKYPYGYSRIANIQIIPATYSESMKNVRAKIYDNINDFNQVNDRYIALCDENTDLDIRQTSAPTPYLLLELDSENNTTPCVGRIRLEFA